MKTIKLWGAFRSCTNLVGYLCETSLEGVSVIHTAGNHKHSIPRHSGEDLHVLCVKHPLAWALSMERYTKIDIRILGCLWSHQTNSLIDFWMTHSRPAPVLVKYGDLLRDPNPIMASIAYKLGLPAPTVFLPAGKVTRAGDGVRVEETSTPFDTNEYLEERWRERLDARAVGVISEYLDPELMRFLGYTL